MDLIQKLLTITLLTTVLLYSVSADSDDSHGIDGHGVQIDTVPTCNRLKIPGFPDFYIETFVIYWETFRCPRNMFFDELYCDCVLAIGEKRQKMFVKRTALSPVGIYIRRSLSDDHLAVQNSGNFYELSPTPAVKLTAVTTTTTVLPPTQAVRKLETTQADILTKLRFTTETITSTPTTTEKRRGIVKILFHLDKKEAERRTMPTTTPVMMVKPTERQEVVQQGSGVLSRNLICSGCRFEGGIGYKNHERDCDKYVMCSPSGVKGNLKADVRTCGVGEYWDQTLLTCRLSKDVPCSTDKCKSRGNWFTYSYDGDCRAYWKCEDGLSVGHCCPKGQSYVNGIGCLRNPSCDTSCGVPVIEKGCGKRPVPGNPKKFRQTIAGHGDIDMDCAAGTVFSQYTCDCQTDTEASRISHVCKKELDLSFSPEVVDISGKNVHVSGLNVTYGNGEVCFQGDGAIVVPRFANAEIGKRLYISLRFKPTEELIGNEMQAVVYNGDCGMDPSVVVAAKKDKILYKLRNKSNSTSTLAIDLPMKVNEWITGKFSLENDVMSMTVNGRTENSLFFGEIDRSRCGLKLGWGKHYDSFVGCIDKMSISFCRNNAF